MQIEIDLGHKGTSMVFMDGALHIWDENSNVIIVKSYYNDVKEIIEKVIRKEEKQ